MEHYERVAKIGEGASGVVYKARDRRTGENVAVKRLRIVGDDFDALAEEALLRDVPCLEACRGHPSLVELRAAHRNPVDAGAAFLVMEYVDGPSLAQVMGEEDRDGPRRQFAEADASRVMRQLLEGARAMHERGILHRDLKPDDVLVDGRGDVKICDFGLSRNAAADGAPPYTPSVVTLWYRAPELILGCRDYDARVDTWALGCIMAELLAGGPLFPGRSEMEQLNKVFDTVSVQESRVMPAQQARLRAAAASGVAVMPAQQAARPAPGDVSGIVSCLVRRPERASGLQTRRQAHRGGGAQVSMVRGGRGA